MRVICGDSEKVLDDLLNEGVQVDMILTSPPYDDLREYGESGLNWNLSKFKAIAGKLYQILKEGCIMVWIVGDAVIGGGESLSSFKQAIYFGELGFRLHDTMIYEKNSASFPAKKGSKRYTQIFEYMFVFVKGDIRQDIELLMDKPNKYAGQYSWGNITYYEKDGKLVQKGSSLMIGEYGMRNNIWKYNVGLDRDNKEIRHPAIFPEKLAEDHIKSWSVKGDTVLDPFAGSMTTGKMAVLNGRKFIGIEMNPEYYAKGRERVERAETLYSSYLIK